MAPHQHLEWFDENINWFAELPVEAYGIAVPGCPGWDVEKVITHLTFGLGLAYPHAMASHPDTDADSVFDGVAWPASLPREQAARDAFAQQMQSCASTFAETDPDLPCWTYAGPGTARFWFQRAAIETALHRMDVAEALGDSGPLQEDRAWDAVVDAVQFVLPLAASIVGRSPGALTVRVSGVDKPLLLGSGSPQAELLGSGTDVLSALWGRHIDKVEVSGAAPAAEQWLNLAGSAFAGR